jgi:hypothetical protein
MPSDPLPSPAETAYPESSAWTQRSFESNERRPHMKSRSLVLTLLLFDGGDSRRRADRDRRARSRADPDPGGPKGDRVATHGHVGNGERRLLAGLQRVPRRNPEGGRQGRDPRRVLLQGRHPQRQAGPRHAQGLVEAEGGPAGGEEVVCEQIFEGRPDPEGHAVLQIENKMDAVVEYELAASIPLVP